jgi:hypothetical protein
MGANPPLGDVAALQHAAAAAAAHGLRTLVSHDAATEGSIHGCHHQQRWHRRVLHLDGSSALQRTAVAAGRGVRTPVSHGDAAEGSLDGCPITASAYYN